MFIPPVVSGGESRRVGAAGFAENTLSVRKLPSPTARGGIASFTAL
jgi:hypothetical protein